MDRMIGSGWLRAAAAVVVVFVSALLAAPAPSAAAGYTLSYSGTITTSTSLFQTFGFVAGDSISGSITIDPFNTDVYVPSTFNNAYEQSSVTYTINLSHPGKSSLSYSDSGFGDIVSVGTPATTSGVGFNLFGADSSLELRLRTDATMAPLTSLAGLPDTPTGLIAFFAGSSPRAFGEFHLGSGAIIFDIAFAATPIPAALPLLMSALGGLGFAAWRRRARPTSA